MRRFILFFLAFLLSVWIGVKIAIDPGYVLIARQNWTAEMPLWVAAAGLLLAFFLLYGILRLLRNVRMLPTRWRLKIARRREQRAQELTHYGLLALLAGDWRAAEKKLGRAGQRGSLAWFSCLAAAIACHAQHAFERRDNYLIKARAKKPETEVAVGILRAQFQLQQRQFEQARFTLQHLHQLAPKQTYINYLLAQVYITLKDWHDLPDLLTVLRQQKILPYEQIAALETQTYCELLLTIGQQADLTRLQSAWNNLPRPARINPRIVASYSQALVKKAADDEAEELIRKTLIKNWDAELVRCYGLIKSSKLDRQLTTAESWLPTHENDSALLLTLGRLCLYNQLWGKARSYLQTSITLLASAEAYLELGKLHEQLENSEAALECYRKGLQL